MNQENKNRLLKTFPQMYGQNFHFGVGDGWYKLIYKLSQDIVDLCLERGMEIPRVLQVKEKFGVLRFYPTGVSSDEIHQLIYNAETESFKICELCGSTENVKTRPKDEFGWLKTSCEECF